MWSESFGSARYRPGGVALLTGLLVVALGCAPVRPAWYTQTRSLLGSDRVVVGQGACPEIVKGASGLACALDRARGDVAASLRSKIRVDQVHRCDHRTQSQQIGKDVRRTGRSTCSDLLEVHSTPIELAANNLAPSRQSCPGDGFCYVQIHVSRPELTSTVRASMRPRIIRLRTLLKGAADADLITALPMIVEAERVAASLEPDAELLRAVTRGRDPWLSLLEQPTVLRAQRVENTSVCVESQVEGVESEALLAPMRDSLARSGFPFAEGATTDKCSGAALVISVLELGPIHRQRVDGSGASLWIATQRVATALTDRSTGRRKRVQTEGRLVAATQTVAEAQAAGTIEESARSAVQDLLWGGSPQ